MATSESSPNIEECDVCAFRYDPAQHAGLDLDDQKDWECPDCQADPDHFHIVVPPSDDVAEDDPDGDEDDEQPALTPGVRAIYREKSEPDVASLKRRYDKGR